MLIHVACTSVLSNSCLNCNPAKSAKFIYESNSDFKHEIILTETAKCNLTILSYIYQLPPMKLCYSLLLICVLLIRKKMFSVLMGECAQE